MAISLGYPIFRQTQMIFPMINPIATFDCRREDGKEKKPPRRTSPPLFLGGILLGGTAKPAESKGTKEQGSLTIVNRSETGITSTTDLIFGRSWRVGLLTDPKALCIQAKHHQTITNQVKSSSEVTSIIIGHVEQQPARCRPLHSCGQHARATHLWAQKNHQVKASFVQCMLDANVYDSSVDHFPSIPIHSQPFPLQWFSTGHHDSQIFPAWLPAWLHPHRVFHDLVHISVIFEAHFSGPRSLRLGDRLQLGRHAQLVFPNLTTRNC